MTIRRGVKAPQNTFIDILIQKFDTQQRKFVITNPLLPRNPIIFCNEAFCEWTGHSKAEIVQRPSQLEFLHGPLTTAKSISQIRRALDDHVENVVSIILYKKDGTRLPARVTVAPVRNEVGEVRLYILTFENLAEQDTVLMGGMGMPAKVSELNCCSCSWRYLLPSAMWPRDHPDPCSPSTEKPRKHRKSRRRGESSQLPRASSTTAGATIGDPLHSHTRPNLDLSEDKERGHGSTSREGRTQEEDDQSDSSLTVTTPSLDRSPEPMHYSAWINQSLRSIGGTEATAASGEAHTDVSILGEDSSPKLHVASSIAAPFSMKHLRRRDGLVVNTQDVSRHRVSMKFAQMLSLGEEVHSQHQGDSSQVARCTMRHHSAIKAIWDWLVLILVIYTAIVTPYTAAFLLNDDRNKRDVERRVLDTFEIMVDIFFVLDILVNFRTTYVNDNDELVSEPGRIAAHYFKGWFLIDLVAAIPFDFLIFSSKTDDTATLIGLLKTARLLRLVRVVRKLDRYSEYGAAALLLLMALFALISHWLACVWYAIGNIERPDIPRGTGWLNILSIALNQPYHPDTKNVTHAGGPDIRSKYITALYFTISSLTSVGFGNVSPNTNAEKVFSICVMLIGSLMYATIFGNVSAIIQRLYSGSARFLTQLLQVREFIRFYQIPDPLRQRLLDTFQHTWALHNGIDMNLVLKGFPECLQGDVCIHLNRHLFHNCPAFKNASQGCLRSLAVKFKASRLPPGDILMHSGDMINSLFFLSRGSIEILSSHGSIVAILGRNDIFGEHPRVGQEPSKSGYTVRSLTYCDLHRIHSNDLLDILDKYPEFDKVFNANLELTFDLKDKSTDNATTSTTSRSDPRHMTDGNFSRNMSLRRSGKMLNESVEQSDYLTEDRGPLEEHHQPTCRRYRRVEPPNTLSLPSQMSKSQDAPSKQSTRQQKKALISQRLSGLEDRIQSLEAAIKPEMNLIFQMLRVRCGFSSTFARPIPGLSQVSANVDAEMKSTDVAEREQ